MDKEELNKSIENEPENIDSMKGFEIIAESMVEKIYDIFGRNSLLSMLYQTGAGPGHKIAKRLKDKYGEVNYTIEEALEILLKELKEFYSIKIQKVEEDATKLRIVIANKCFLRDPFKDREKLQFGKAFCRINKGYFEVALKELLGDEIKKIEINFLHDDPEKDACIEELIFYKKEVL